MLTSPWSTPKTVTALRQEMEDSVNGRRALNREHRIVRPDGEERRVHVRAQPMSGSDGLVVGLRGIGQDVTDKTLAALLVRGTTPR